MSMSTHVIAFRPPDKKWHRMKAIYDACVAGDIEIPDEVEDFFNGEPDEKGVEVEIDKIVEDWDDGCGSGSGYQIELSKLPKGITVLRFYNSW